MLDQDTLSIRTATKDDREAIYKMICGLEAHQLDRPGFDQAFDINIINPGICYFLAFLDENPVGVLSCHIQPLLHHAALVAEIQEMYVDPEFRSLQIGKALMQAAVAHAKGRGAIQIEVTSRGTRERAHQFYQKEGFEKSHVKLVRYFKNEA